MFRSRGLRENEAFILYISGQTTRTNLPVGENLRGSQVSFNNPSHTKAPQRTSVYTRH